MRTIEQYWQDCEDFGFLRSGIPGGLRFSLPPRLGEGGFEIWGDPSSAMACVTDLTLHKPCVLFEHTHEKYLEFGQLYAGDLSYYKKRSETFPVECGLNYLVNCPSLSGYKRMEPGIRLISVGISYRERFFDTLPFQLPEDFWETAAGVLNPDPVVLPPVTLICEQLKSCRLTGTQLELFVRGKALEALALTLHYVYAHRKAPAVRLTSQDRAALERVKELLRERLLSPPGIRELAVATGMNQRKLMAGFKQLNGITIYTYLKHLRMEKAAGLLQENSLPISEVARAVGYHGDGHFQKAFRDVYGVSPGRLCRELQAR